MILEPVVGNSGFIVPSQAFLQGLRELCTAEGALLCFDEVRRVAVRPASCTAPRAVVIWALPARPPGGGGGIACTLADS